MGNEEGFSSVEDVGERKPLFGRFRNSREPVVQEEGVGRPESADAFLEELRLQTTVWHAIDLDLKQLNKTMLCIGEVLDELKEGLKKPKEVERDESRIE